MSEHVSDEALWRVASDSNEDAVSPALEAHINHCEACQSRLHALLDGIHDEIGRSTRRVIAGRYEVGRKLGEGGRGAVYKGWDVKLPRNVAAV